MVYKNQKPDIYYIDDIDFQQDIVYTQHMSYILLDTNTCSYMRIPINWVSARAVELAFKQNVVRIHECSLQDMLKLNTFGILKFGWDMEDISLTTLGKKCLIDEENAEYYLLVPIEDADG